MEPNNQYTQFTFAEVESLFAELCENAPELISLTEDELASAEVVTIRARNKVVFLNATSNHYEVALSLLLRTVIRNHSHRQVAELLISDWTAITGQLPDETPQAFLERVFALRRRIKMYAELDNGNLDNMSIVRGAVTLPRNPGRVVIVLAPTPDAVKEKVRMGINHVELTEATMAIANMDQFRKAVIMQYEAQRARVAVQAVVKKRRASTQMHSVITADVSEGYIAQGAINKSKRICDFWKRRTCYFGLGCKFLHEGPGACIPKPVGFSVDWASKRSQAVRKKIPQRSQTVNLSSDS